MKKKVLFLTLVVFAVVSSISIFASYSGSYSFDIGYQTTGTTEL